MAPACPSSTSLALGSPCDKPPISSPGGRVKFKEYIAVGKGRDMGFDSINSFESKVREGRGVRRAPLLPCAPGRLLCWCTSLLAPLPPLPCQVSGGNGEQVMSRDVHRMATRFDFFRLLSFYHSGCGFFINTFLVRWRSVVMVAIVVVVGGGGEGGTWADGALS